jgi:ubiquinone/menaquinone biosynthesis C-methylase UbiE/thymidylate synthase
MTPNYFTSETLEGAWLRALKAVTISGKMIKEKESFLEIRNIQISYNNAFETEFIHYEQIFGRSLIDYMHRVYSPSGDTTTGRNYYDLIYNQSGLDQVENVIKKLEIDPLTRSAIIVLASPKSKKIPCITEIAFSVRQNILNMSVIFKSSDFAKKFIPDMIELSHIHKYISNKLHIPRGEVSAMILVAQIYTTDLKIVKEKVLKLKDSGYFNSEKMIENWNKRAENWDEYVKDPNHYVNFENGYNRFLKFVNNEIPKNERKTPLIALDSGCGTGIISEVLNNKGYKTVGIDISPEMLTYAHKKGSMRHYVLANSLDIPYTDNYFDLICSRGVLISHVGKNYVNMFIEEHYRVLKKGGLFMFDFITFFNKDEIKNKKIKVSITFKEISKILESYGFKVLKRSGEDNNRVNAILCKKI